MLESLIEFIKFYPSAISKYRVHSPFVSRVIDEIIYGTKVPSNQEYLENIRLSFLNNHRKISRSTLGVPSRLFGSGTRSIRQVAKASMTPRWQAEILFRLVDYLKPETMLELGTCLGVTTLYQYSGNTNAIFRTLEGHPDLFAESSNLFDSFQYQGLKGVKGKFVDVLPNILHDLKRVDYAFIDGDHTKDGLQTYLKMLLPYTDDSSVVVLHDIHWSSNMAEAWNELRRHPRVTVSIDIFYLGILFFRKEIEQPIHINLISHRYKPWQNGIFH